jgi:hypothetical protein
MTCEAKQRAHEGKTRAVVHSSVMPDIFLSEPMNISAHIHQLTLHLSVYGSRNISVLYSSVPRNLKTLRNIAYFPVVFIKWTLRVLS